MLTILREIDRRDRVLSRLGWFQLALTRLMLLAMPVDHRTILGLNPWIKPAKFAMSIAIYAWTLAWFFPYLTGPAWTKGLVRWGTVVTMVVEIVCIAGQSLRGVPSHFNDASAFDIAVFGVMGSMILFSTGLDVLLLVLFFRRHVALPAAYLWGIRTGIAGVIVGAGIGLLMVAKNSHSVGGPDGGPGLPMLNWNTQHGDLRPAHVLALHACRFCHWRAFSSAASCPPGTGARTTRDVRRVRAGLCNRHRLAARRGPGGPPVDSPNGRREQIYGAAIVNGRDTVSVSMCSVTGPKRSTSKARPTALPARSSRVVSTTS